MNRREALKLMGVAALSITGRSLHGQPQPPVNAPNFLFIMISAGMR